jgi:broad specificity phosphatase PhoE
MRLPKDLASPNEANIVFVRHGEGENNADFQGQIRSGIPNRECHLTERGRRQAEIARDYLSHSFGLFDVLMTSPFVRAKETLEILAPNCSYSEHASLTEWFRGVWHTLPKDEIRKKHPEEWERERRGRMSYFHRAPGGGENIPDIEVRVREFRSEAKVFLKSGVRLLVVCHGNWYLVMRSLQLEITPENFIPWFKEMRLEGGIMNAEIMPFHYDARNDQMILLAEKKIVPWEGIL